MEKCANIPKGCGRQALLSRPDSLCHDCGAAKDHACRLDYLRSEIASEPEINNVVREVLLFLLDMAP